MTETDRRPHWEAAYSAKEERSVSWFQETPSPSLGLLAFVGAVSPSSSSVLSIIDIVGGISRLVG
jgi:hypothetical protein